MNVVYKDVDTNNRNLYYYPYYFNNFVYSNVLNLFNNQFEGTEIINGLYVGSIRSTFDKEHLKNIGITHIISVIPGYSPPHPDDFKYLIVNALDDENTNLSNVFNDTNKFIDDAFANNGKVLVHCLMGRSRSVTVVSAYLIYSFGMDVDNILNIIKSKRNCIKPNDYFVKQLQQYFKDSYVDFV